MLMILLYWAEANTIKKTTQTLVVGSKYSGLEVNADKSKYMVICQDQDAGESHNIKINYSNIEMVERFKCLGTTPTKQNSIWEEIKSCLQSGNVWYNSEQDLFSSILLPKNIKIKVYRTIILPVLCMGVKLVADIEGGN